MSFRPMAGRLVCGASIPMNSEHLSTALFRETRGTGFFRVLAGRNAAFYVDALDDLEREAADRLADTRKRARLILEHLIKCRWLEEPPRRNWRRKVYFDTHGATLITALRKIAWPDAAVFTDK